MSLPKTNEPVIFPPQFSENVVKEDGTANNRLYSFFQGLASRIPIEDSGNPEGRFEANAGRLYIDRDGSQGSRIYMKTTNGGNTGWEIA